MYRLATVRVAISGTLLSILDGSSRRATVDSSDRTMSRAASPTAHLLPFVDGRPSEWQWHPVLSKGKAHKQLSLSSMQRRQGLGSWLSQTPRGRILKDLCGSESKKRRFASIFLWGGRTTVFVHATHPRYATCKMKYDIWQYS